LSGERAGKGKAREATNTSTIKSISGLKSINNLTNTHTTTRSNMARTKQTARKVSWLFIPALVPIPLIVRHKKQRVQNKSAQIETTISGNTFRLLIVWVLFGDLILLVHRW
jgi:hypothetical protein